MDDPARLRNSAKKKEIHRVKEKIKIILQRHKNLYIEEIVILAREPKGLVLKAIMELQKDGVLKGGG